MFNIVDLLVAGLLSERRHQTRLTGKHMTIQIQRRDVAACNTPYSVRETRTHTHTSIIKEYFKCSI